MATIRMSRPTIIDCAHDCGLSGLRALAAVAATTYDGRSSGLSMRRLAELLKVDRRALKKNMRRVVASGFVLESRATRNRSWRQVPAADGDGIEVGPDAMKIFSQANDAGALWLLMKSLGNEKGELVIDFDDLARRASTSRDTINRRFAELQEIGWARRERVGRSEYRIAVDLTVPAGTPADSTQVRRADFSSIEDRALALMRRLRA